MPMLLLLLLTGEALPSPGKKELRIAVSDVRPPDIIISQPPNTVPSGRMPRPPNSIKKHIGSTQPMPRLRCNTECADGEYPPTHCQLP